MAQKQSPRRSPGSGRFSHAHQWTPEEDEILRTMMPSVAARKLGMSYRVVEKRQKRLGVGLHDVLRQPG